jgi:hypothetical protein
MKFTSSILTTASGKLGGAVASKARGGIKYFRSLVTPSNPKTGGQAAVRAALAGLAGAWKSTLTDGNRAGWTALAADNESGIDVYVGNNSILLQAGRAAVTTAPASRTLPWITIPDLSEWQLQLDSGNFVLKSPDAAALYMTAATTTLLVFLEAGVQIPSRLAQQFPFRFGAKQVTPASTAVFTLTVPGSKFPELSSAVEDNRVWVRIIGCNATGQVTGDIRALMPLVAV